MAISPGEPNTNLPWGMYRFPLLSPWRSPCPPYEGKKLFSLTSLPPIYMYTALTQYFTLPFFSSILRFNPFTLGLLILVWRWELSCIPVAECGDIACVLCCSSKWNNTNPWKPQRLFFRFLVKRRKCSRSCISSLRENTSALPRQHDSNGPGKLLLFKRSNFSASS